MTIKDWNLLSDATRLKVAQKLAAIEGISDSGIITNLAKKYISSTAKLTPLQKLNLQLLKRDNKGQIIINAKIHI